MGEFFTVSKLTSCNIVTNISLSSPELLSTDMKNTYFLPTKAATPEDILDILRDMHRHAKTQGDLARHIRRLGKDSLVHDLNIALNTGETATKIGAFFNETFALKVASSDWQAILEPVEKTSLWQTCNFIAQHAVVPAVEPVTVLGCESKSIGAFLALRSIIWDLEGKRLEIRPSTHLNDIPAGGPFCKLFLSFWKLAPAVLPKLSYKEKTALSSEGCLFRDKIVRLAKWSVGIAMSLMIGVLGVALAVEAVDYFLRREDLISDLSSLGNILLILILTLLGASAALGITAMVITLRGISYRLHYPKIETLGELARLIADNKH